MPKPQTPPRGTPQIQGCPHSPECHGGNAALPRPHPRRSASSTALAVALVLAILLPASPLASPSARAATPTQPQSDFQLKDANPNSPRYRTTVSPRDYRLQVSAFYFADSGCSYCRAQLEPLQRLQRELATLNPGLHVQILGVNRTSSEPYNYIIGLTPNILPWLQDTAAQSIWFNWGVAYRDVLILDGLNRLVGRDNLTAHDLRVAANYEALKSTLLQAATATDSDKDGLLDDWEILWFNTLETAPTADPDGDGFDNGQEFAFGSAPDDAKSFPRVRPNLTRTADGPVFSLSFPRFSGGAVAFVVETATGLGTWSPAPQAFLATGATTPLYNGLGGAETHFQHPATGPQTAGFFRIRPISKLGPP